MDFFKTNKIEKVWKNICEHEGETFYTMRKKPYNYAIFDDYVLVNNDKRRRITKVALEKALSIVNPTPSKIEKEGLWAPSYIYGIITDNRIV